MNFPLQIYNFNLSLINAQYFLYWNKRGKRYADKFSHFAILSKISINYSVDQRFILFMAANYLHIGYMT